MRCSSFEAQLSAYVDGELGPVASVRVARHLEACEPCRSIVAELRAVDALLLTAREPDIAPNFSFKVMAEVRTLPAPRAHRARPVAMLATYVVFAWVAIGAFLLLGGSSARAMLGTISRLFGHVAAASAMLATASGRLFGKHVFDVTAAMGGLLAIDLVVAGIAIAAYALLRGRRTASAGAPDSW